MNDRLFEVLGSKNNREPFAVLGREMNGVKGRIFQSGGLGERTNIVDEDDIEEMIQNSVRNGMGTVKSCGWSHYDV
jgi:hypothetical protein